MARSLVTGGAGFIGAHVAECLLERGDEVVVLDDLSGGFVENVPQGAEFVEASILDHERIDRLFAERRFEHVYHLAAYAAEGLSNFIKRFNHTNNLVGSVNLINASINTDVRCFVFTSSIAVYGSTPPPMTEDTAAVPNDSYGISKLAVERELANTKRAFGLDYVVFRPHNVYGEKQNIGDRYRNVIGIFMNQLLRGEPMTIFGDGEQQRAFTHVSGVAPLIAACVDRPEALGQILNVGADHPCTVNRLAELVAEAMGAPCRTVHLPARDEVALAYSDHGKAERIFGPARGGSLEAHLRDMAAWAKEHGARESRPFHAVEVARNLPPIWLQ